MVITNTPRSFWNTKVFRNSISDFHSLVATVLNLKYVKPKPKIINYRDYRNFNLENFQRDLLSVFSSGCNDYETFEGMFLSTLNLHAPLKKKTIRGNHAPYMNRNVRKAMMRRNQLHTKWTKTCKDQDKVTFKNQRKLVSELLKKAKKNYYNNLDDKDVLDNKKFWNQIKSSFTDKVIIKNKITLVDGNNLITDDQEQTEIFKNFFGEVINNLDIQENRLLLNEEGEDQGEIGNIISKFKYHPSILEIKKRVSINDIFNFKQVSEEEVYQQV